MARKIISEKDIHYKKILRETMKESLKITQAKEALILYGTNQTFKKHLPQAEWDRAAFYNVRSMGLLNGWSKIKTGLLHIAKVLPIPLYVDENGEKVEKAGLAPFLLNRRSYFYRKGITVLFVPEVKRYIENENQPFVYTPVFSYNGYEISKLEEELKVNVHFSRIGRSKNFLQLHLPHFGVLVLNNCNPELFKEENVSKLKDSFNRLITYVNKASLAYYHQKGKFISETQRLEDMLEKEEMLRELGAVLRSREEELLHNIMALDKVTKEKYELELQRDKLSEEVLKAQQVIKEIGDETDTNLATIAHTAKNLYMAQKSFTNFVSEDIGIVGNDLEELEKYLVKITARYPKLNNYQFWKVIFNTIKNIRLNQKGLIFNNRRSSEHMIQIMEYILSVLAYQRGREYMAEGKYYSDLLKIVKHIKSTHQRRLDELGIEFTYENKSGDPKVLINNIYHFHLEKDVFINLLLNSIEAFTSRPRKKIWIEIYSEGTGTGMPFYEIHYRDNGMGIPEDKKQAIFEGWTSKQQGGRAGIDDKTEHGVGGKTILKRIKNARGSIKEIGVPGEGAHFVIRLEKFIEDKDDNPEAGEELYIEPLDNRSTSRQAGKSDEAFNTVAGKNILIVDDDEKIRDYIASIFKDVLTPNFASGHEDAWNNIYSTSPPDVMTLDLDLLSTEKGENLLFDLNTRGITKKIPVIIVSGADRVYEVEKLTKLGAAAVFHKPVKEEALRKVVFELLTGKKAAVVK